MRLAHRTQLSQCGTLKRVAPPALTSIQSPKPVSSFYRYARVSTIRRGLKVNAAKQQGEDNDGASFPDPEAKYRRYGKDFGGAYFLNNEFLDSAPRVRFRNSQTRGKNQLVELAVLNERLAGSDPTAIRRKVEYLKTRRKNWEMIYEYITRSDVVATLKSLEEANRKVEEALSEESRETTGVGDLRKQLVELQQEVNTAHQKLHLTEARVKQNMDRIKALKTEVNTWDNASHISEEDTAQLAAMNPHPEVESSTVSIPASTATAPANFPPTRPSQRGNRGLDSSMDIEEGLRNFWYPVAFTSKLSKDTLLPIDLLDEPWVLFRDENGNASCIRDECAHRACPLSLGKVIDGHVSCPYHGWEYNAFGDCVKMPSTVQCKNIGVTSLPVAEKDGFVWIWSGDDLPPEVPGFTPPPSGYAIHAEIEVDVPVEHGLLLENLLDLAHAPFTHTSTFAKGWPIPDFVKFKAAKVLGGNWEPYPIDMSFEPPCMVVSKIGLMQPGKIVRGQRAETCKNHLHQLHVCVPSRRGHVRLLYRMSLDFMHWIKYVPFIDEVWKSVANQVLGEDLVLVEGQQDRLIKGGDTWAHPVAYDKLAVRYRRWRNSVDGGGEDVRQSGSTKMSAGEIFEPENEGSD